jgi:hypothetical protein
MEKLIAQLELVLEKLDAVDEHVAALHLDSCISMLCENYKVKRRQVCFDPIKIESEDLSVLRKPHRPIGTTTRI